MADQPISQEILLPTNVDQVNAATKKLDELLARVAKLDKAGESRHGHEKKNAKESESAFHNLFDAMGKVVKREVELAAGIRSIGAAGLEAKHKVGEFLEFVGAVAALELLEKLGDKVIDIGKEAIVSAAKAERMNMAIDAAAGGKERGEQARKWIEQYSKHSIFSEHENESAYVDLARHGVKGQSTGLFMKASEDLAAIADPEKAAGVRESALAALEHAHTQGRVSGRSIGELGIGVDALRTIPRFAGIKNNAKLLEAAERSNLDENELLTLIAHATGEKGLGARGSEASESLYTRMQKVAELPDLFYKRLADTKGIKVFSDALGHVLEVFDPNSPNGKQIFGALESTFKSIGDAVGEIDFQDVADTITTDVLPAIKGMASLLPGIIADVDQFVRGLHVAHDLIFGKVTESAAMTAIGDQKWGQPVDELAFLKKSEGKTVQTASGGEAHVWHGKMHMVGESAGEGLAAGIEASTNQATAAASRMAEQTEGAARRKLRSHSPSEAMADVGEDAGAGFALGLDRMAPHVADIMDSTIRVPSSVYGGNFASIAGKLRGDTNLSVVVNVQGGPGPGQDPTGVGEAVALAVRREVTALLERTGDEG